MASKAYEDMCAEIIGNLHIQLKEAELEVYRLTKLLQEHGDNDLVVHGSINSLRLRDDIGENNE